MTRRCLDSTCRTPTTTPPGRRSKTRETSPAEEVRQTAVNCLFSNFYSLSLYCQTSTVFLFIVKLLRSVYIIRLFSNFYDMPLNLSIVTLLKSVCSIFSFNQLYYLSVRGKTVDICCHSRQSLFKI